MLLFNRLLPVGIIVYRYIYVCQSHLVATALHRRRFNIILSSSICGLSLGLTLASAVYRDKNLLYYHCMGREAEFHQKNLSGRNSRYYIYLNLIQPQDLSIRI